MTDTVNSEREKRTSESGSERAAKPARRFLPKPLKTRAVSYLLNNLPLFNWSPRRRCTLFNDSEKKWVSSQDLRVKLLLRKPIIRIHSAETHKECTKNLKNLIRLLKAIIDLADLGGRTDPEALDSALRCEAALKDLWLWANEFLEGISVAPGEKGGLSYRYMKKPLWRKQDKILPDWESEGRNSKKTAPSDQDMKEFWDHRIAGLILAIFLSYDKASISSKGKKWSAIRIGEFFIGKCPVCGHIFCRNRIDHEYDKPSCRVRAIRKKR